uniref:Uncharacterized protein n=1 Tax=Chromera velia CCMP2878 TaxID=1169474 RepID=A0A0G4IED2_9ALVE|eukprot:Cvel_13707.t1-p1 / transcript=Cvel_13707.t1 / gene=Cvel_13707 / organism=Chromera_velia_CCMP2878 / gene_product=Nucleotide-binding oligomerization, putative / transcript_product=Nucleotide-binding oligomerization, putative / location=Cvel_scaffold947:35461-42156(+) / protein_length=746 / sequence_SO=supercontig / SO=protein_coding / is_pseudo=false
MSVTQNLNPNFGLGGTNAAQPVPMLSEEQAKNTSNRIRDLTIGPTKATVSILGPSSMSLLPHYKASKPKKELPRELQRPLRIKSLERVKAIPDSLTDLCFKKLADNFARLPESFLDYLSDAESNAVGHQFNDSDLTKIYDYIDPNLPIPVAAPRIDDENYWQRRAILHRRRRLSGSVLSGSGQPRLHEHGGKWKRLYLETELARSLESLPLDPTDEEMDTLKEQLKNSSPSVVSLKVNQLPSHMDVVPVLEGLPHLSKLQITFGERRLGMHYDRGSFGMKLSDAMSLCEALRRQSERVLLQQQQARAAKMTGETGDTLGQTAALTAAVLQERDPDRDRGEDSGGIVELCLPSNLIEDELVQTLSEGLRGAAHASMLKLSLSHNKVGDVGAESLSELLKSPSLLEELDLSDNQVHAYGALRLGAALMENAKLTVLNLKMNRLGDEGVSHLAECLTACDNQQLALKELNLASNGATKRSLPSLCGFLKGNCTVTKMDLSGNKLCPLSLTLGGSQKHPGSVATAAELDPKDVILRQGELGERPEDEVQEGGDGVGTGGGASGEGATADGSGEGGNGGKDESAAPKSQTGDEKTVNALIEAVNENTALLKLDIALCGFPQDVYQAMQTAVKRRDLQARGIPVDRWLKVVQRIQMSRDGAGAAAGEGGEAGGAEGGEQGAEGGQGGDGQGGDGVGRSEAGGSPAEGDDKEKKTEGGDGPAGDGKKDGEGGEAAHGKEGGATEKPAETEGGS